MANCKDCLGFEFCLDRLGTTKYYDNAIAANNVEELCQKFKDRNRFVELPCKVGDTVYVKMQFGGYAEAEVRDYSYFISCGFCVVVTSIKFDKQNIPFSEFGKTVFLTREEAERALNSSEKTNS